MKKKVCVISAYAYIVNYINYGSLLQYYALEQKLDELGYDPFWLRFVIDEPDKGMFNRIKVVGKIVLNVSGMRDRRNILKKFRKFINKNLKVSSEVYHEESLFGAIPEADAYVTGSDQVWGGTLKANFLCFVPEEKLKIAYAASFGKVNLPDSQIKTITPWVKRVNYISVREESGKALCHRMGVEAEKVLDPTLLLDGDRYPADHTATSKEGRFWFGYFLNVQTAQAAIFSQMDAAASEHGAKMLYTAGVSGIDALVSPSSVRYLSPEAWIGMYKAAEAICTNTFHGTVFALIFHKPFLVFLQEGKSAEQNERLYALLKMVGLENRIYEPSAQIGEQMKIGIEWSHVDEIIKKERNHSIRFLVHALERKC